MDSHINQRRSDGETKQDISQHEFEDTNKLDLRTEIQQEYRSNPVSWLEWVFNYIDLPRNSRLLEIGCGTGTFWKANATHLTKSIPASWKMVLSDSSMGMAQKAKLNLAPIRAETNCLNLDGQALPLARESVDAVLAMGVLDLTPHLDQALGEAWRVMRPSGQLFATAGGKGHLQELEDLLRPFLPPGVAEKLGGVEDHFGMENGGQLLARYFDDVVCHDYEDRLVFTNLEPVLDYVLSEQAIAWSIPLNHLGEFVNRIKGRLNQHGSLHVTVRKGLYIARKKVIEDL